MVFSRPFPAQTMLPFLSALVILAGAALLSTYGVRRMIRLAILDHPGHRSSHTHATPKGGGIGIMGAFLVCWPLMHWVTGGTEPHSLGIMTGAAMVLLCAVSWLDDLHQWPPAAKLATQCVAASMIAGGFALTCGLPTLTPESLAQDGTTQAGFSWPVPPWPALMHTLPGWLMPTAGFVGSVLWLVFVTNAVNFMDGLNGLVSGCLLVAALVLAASAPALDAAELVWPALLLVCCLAGFLPYNFPHARIFMGDVGSQGCGLLAGTASLYLVLHTPSRLEGGWLLGPALLAPLLYDVLFTLVRRHRAGLPLAQAHRGHLYQVLHRSGLATPFISFAEWAMTLWGGGAMAVMMGLTPVMGSFYAALVCGILVTTPQLLWTGFTLRRTKAHPIGAWS